MEKKDLHVVGDDKATVLASYSNFLKGDNTRERISFSEFLEDQVGAFLERTQYRNYEELIYVPFDQLTILIWKIKEKETREMGIPSSKNSYSVPEERMKKPEQEWLSRDLRMKYGIELDVEDRQRLLMVATELLNELKIRVIEWTLLYQSISRAAAGTDWEQRKERPLFELLAFNFWDNIGKKLQDLSDNLSSLKFSMQVLSAPVRLNYSMVEKDTILLYQNCLALEKMKQLAEDVDVDNSEEQLRWLLDELKIYPPYHTQYSQAVKLVSGPQTDFYGQPFSRVQRAFQNIKKKALEIFCEDQSGNISTPVDLPADRVEPAGESCFSVRVLEQLRLLLDHNLLDEAEFLVRVYQLGNSQLELTEYNAREESFELWSSQEKWIKDQLALLRRKEIKPI